MIYYFYLKIETIENLVVNLNGKNEYFILIRNLKQALDQGLVLKKINKVTKFKEEARLKSNIDINTESKKAKNENDFFNLMNN